MLFLSLSFKSFKLNVPARDLGPINAVGNLTPSSSAKAKISTLNGNEIFFYLILLMPK